MDTPKKTDKKNELKKSKPTGVKKLNAKPAADQKANFSDEDEDFDMPLDELESFDSFNEYDDEDDY